MRAAVSTIILTALVVAAPCAASAVNCDQVRRYLSTGRSVDDVAETMIISVDEVKKCQQSDAGDKKAGAKPDEKSEKPAPKQ